MNLHLSSLAGSPLVDSNGERLGRVEDLIVRLDAGDELPPVTGLKARIGGREMFVPADRIAQLEPGAGRISTTMLNLGPVLNLLPAAKQLKIKRLLGYNPSTAGGLMNPDFASLPADATVAQGLERVRQSELAPGQLLVLWVIDMQGNLVGGVFASELVCAELDAPVTSLIETRVPMVSPETELPEVARLMADFNLLAIPVVDSDGKPIGVVAFDDVFELLLPDEWRRRVVQARG